MFASSPISNSHFGTRLPRSIRPVPLRTRRRRKPFTFSAFHTLQKQPRISFLESILSILFEKQRGVYPRKRNSGETHPSFIAARALGALNSPLNRSRHDT